MSRRCVICSQPFRPDFGAQRWCKPCARTATTHPREENTMSTAPDPVQAELLPATTDTAHQPAGLYGTLDPALVIPRAVEISDALARVIRDKRLYATINRKEHVLVEGWTLLGSMLGVFPVTVWTRKLEDGWEARVEARTLAGAIVGAAESECLRSERRWASADDYAVRSMAQTRATSKALRLPLGYVMQLAGFDATPADELPVVDATPPAADKHKLPETARPTREQVVELNELLATLAELDPDTDWRAEARELAGVPGEMLTRTLMGVLLEQLAARLAELVDQAEEPTAA